MKQILVDRLV